jgi:poly-gamma-glutamate capsule biosynthesis protein CapA/YwtB (metallophosphatase superfamily)
MSLDEHVGASRHIRGYGAQMKLVLGGDAMLGRGVDEVIKEKGPGYPLEPLWPLTQAADLCLVNLECAITPTSRLYSGPRKAFYFRADPQTAETLSLAGVHLVSLANNHALDADYKGLLDTLAILEDRGIMTVGAGADLKAAKRPALLNARGQTLTVIACCDHQADFAATPKRPGIHYLDLENPGAAALLVEEVAALAADHLADHLVVSLHWQPNWAPSVAPAYRKLARRLIEAGARIVWGHSPHHFQGVERHESGVILYSTGDLVDDYAVDPHFRNDRQLLFEVELRPKEVGRVFGYPLELDYAQTRQAGEEARRWIKARFRAMCAELGSQVVVDNGRLEVLP